MAGNGGIAGVIGTDGIARITSISRFDDVRPGAISIQYLGADHYAVEPAGFGGPVFAPDEQVASPNGIYDFAGEPLDAVGWGWSLEIYTGGVAGSFDYLTFGDLSDTRSGGFIDFFVAGTISANGPIGGIAAYSGIVDGLVVEQGHARRLFGSSARAEIDTAGTVTLVMELSDRDGAFLYFRNFPTTTLGRASGSTRQVGGNIRTGSLAGPQGYSGSFWGNLFGPNGAEGGIAFELSTPTGDRVIGIVALKRSGGN